MLPAAPVTMTVFPSICALICVMSMCISSRPSKSSICTLWRMILSSSFSTWVNDTSWRLMLFFRQYATRSFSFRRSVFFAKRMALMLPVSNISLKSFTFFAT